MSRLDDVQRVPSLSQDVNKAHRPLPVVEELGDRLAWPALKQVMLTTDVQTRCMCCGIQARFGNWLRGYLQAVCPAGAIRLSQLHT